MRIPNVAVVVLLAACGGSGAGVEILSDGSPPLDILPNPESKDSNRNDSEISTFSINTNTDSSVLIDSEIFDSGLLNVDLKDTFSFDSFTEDVSLKDIGTEEISVSYDAKSDILEIPDVEILDSGFDSGVEAGLLDAAPDVDTRPSCLGIKDAATWCENLALPSESCGVYDCGDPNKKPADCGFCSSGTCGGGGGKHICGDCVDVTSTQYCGAGKHTWYCPWSVSAWIKKNCVLSKGNYCCPGGP